MAEKLDENTEAGAAPAQHSSGLIDRGDEIIEFANVHLTRSLAGLNVTSGRGCAAFLNQGTVQRAILESRCSAPIQIRVIWDNAPTTFDLWYRLRDNRRWVNRMTNRGTIIDEQPATWGLAPDARDTLRLTEEHFGNDGRALAVQNTSMHYVWFEWITTSIVVPGPTVALVSPMSRFVIADLGAEPGLQATITRAETEPD